MTGAQMFLGGRVSLKPPPRAERLHGSIAFRPIRTADDFERWQVTTCSSPHVWHPPDQAVGQNAATLVLVEFIPNMPRVAAPARTPCFRFGKLLERIQDHDRAKALPVIQVLGIEPGAPTFNRSLND